VSPRSEVSAIASLLAIGESTRCCCVFCDSTDRTLSITRDENCVRYLCFRATCSKQGVIALSGANAPVSSQIKKPKRIFYNDLVPLPPSIELDLILKYNLNREVIRDADWRWVPYSRRLWMPIRDPYNKTIGCVLRALDGRSPKTLPYWDDETGVRASFHSPIEQRSGAALAIVEGSLDGVRLTKEGHLAVSLLGSSCDQRTASAIYQWAKSKGVSRIVIWLDPDALAKAIAIRNKWAPIWGDGVQVIQSRADPKDSSSEEIEKHLGN
jgi:hypothetical protein